MQMEMAALWSATLRWIPQGSSLSFQPAPVYVLEGSVHQCTGCAWPDFGGVCGEGITGMAEAAGSFPHV